MSYPINYPTPQGANVQIFYAGVATNHIGRWTKPQGASFVWFTLIGAGGNGNGTTGGGSGSVTNFMCPAFLIPDSLQVTAGVPGAADSQVRYQQKNGAGYQLLIARLGSGGNGGTAMTANAFTAMGFFQAVAGQDGSAASVGQSSTTFLSGGGIIGGSQNSNYDYSSGPSGTNRNGFFQTQPIIVGTSGMGTGKGGIGCGGGDTGTGGNGMVVIITW